MKKIVIAPVFCETHLIKYQIPNIIDTIIQITSFIMRVCSLPDLKVVRR